LCASRSSSRLRSKIVVRLRVRAASTTELAETLGLPKSTVGHHMKVLERAGLLQVVRTRKVRAVTESYYGRTARLFLFKGNEDEGESSVLRVRLRTPDAHRFAKRIEKLAAEIHAADDPAGEPHDLAVALYRRAPDA
jgi:predicted ArsR family transcriptional regulator